MLNHKYAVYFVNGLKYTTTLTHAKAVKVLLRLRERGIVATVGPNL